MKTGRQLAGCLVSFRSALDLALRRACHGRPDTSDCSPFAPQELVQKTGRCRPQLIEDIIRVTPHLRLQALHHDVHR